MKIISKTNNIDIKVKKEKFLSYCTTCMNRLWQLKQTLPYNLSLLDDDEEICLVNYNSQDGLDEWIKDNFMDYINKGKLVYFYTKEPEYFSSPKAKNLAHFLGKGKWLFNLDGDNFITKETRKFIENSKEDNFFIHEYKKIKSGSYGRLCIQKDIFLKCGGYDESFLPMSWQDVHLIKVLTKLYNMSHINPLDKSYNIKKPVRNSQKDKICNTTGGYSFDKMCEINKKKSEYIIENKIYVANKNRDKVKGVLNFKEEIVV